MRFAITGRRAYSAGKTIIALNNPGSGTLRRPRLYHVEIASRDAPLDAALNIDIRRATTVGTNTAVVPAPFDSADPATVITGGENHSAEPTYTSATEFQDVSFNLKATYRWQTAPEWGIIVPGTASNGLGMELLAVSSGTPNLEAVMHFDE